VLCFLVSFESSEVPTHTSTERVRLLFKFRFCVEFFDFRVSAYIRSLLCETRLSAAIFVAPESKKALYLS
jgi:hypothetical protein